MVSPATTIRCISGHWHVVVTVDGAEQFYPAPDKLEAELMMVRARRHLATLRMRGVDALDH
ncbi:hypothetical protein [Aureimonas jatrophae]|jgi:hypothetical protein|uniref:Transposase n=1 Tax=Aureimonas jatrophae TaxID=1166073 RepID=A0A1H0FNC7_9HYPH|nr:hypothetical protein [Aureimonas jatrophae]MBB3949935.1 hypothetical protein [Aureimonas jatrophae]SDN96120.1 hypothetical protein SAMN05192530_102599 [Aureimonas jatrophae]